MSRVVLVIGDEPILRVVLTQGLEQAGYRVIERQAW